MSSSRHSSTTTRMTQATRKQLKPALSRHTCHRAALRPQHGFSQLDLTPEGGRNAETKLNVMICKSEMEMYLIVLVLFETSMVESLRSAFYHVFDSVSASRRQRSNQAQIHTKHIHTHFYFLFHLYLTR
jgi:hypothetical protein